MAYDENLAERIRRLLGSRAEVAEKKMFGSTSRAEITIEIARSRIPATRRQKGEAPITSR
jgi:hypothetical protein